MPSVLVTGASRGVGESIAAHLAAHGWDVFAGVRSDQDAHKLKGESPRIAPVILDVTSSEHVAALGGSLPERLDAVVNNAGVVVTGPMEAVASAELRRQLEVNVVGQVAVTQAVLPRLHRSRGRIVFVSSLNGRVSFPLLGAYCASKFALEAVADALRMELKPWQIPVVIVEPAQTKTDMWQTADTSMEQMAAAMTAEMRQLYVGHLPGLGKAIARTRKTAVPPEKVAKVVEEALTARRPRARYVVGAAPKLLLSVATNLPTSVRDRVLRAVSAQPSRL
ncbi:MAG: SDR family NAD(P)-dependent oxidoreductase [Mycobacterium sp.]|uniref:SDR family NAD(P)-dependent oxidoreductase n=1 Tax=Mycobacterium sp. TaxID=1785 RepID=UPI003F9E7589